MTHYDPHDYGNDDPEDDKPIPRWLWALGFVLWCAVAVGLLTQCSTARAQVPAFLLRLPDGSQQEACDAHYDAIGKIYTFTAAPCAVFADSFEG